MAYEFQESLTHEAFGVQQQYVSAAKFTKTSSTEIDNFRKKHQAVEKLDLSGNDFAKPGMLTSLCSLFRACYNLKEINLSNCNLGALSDEDFTSLIEAIGGQGHRGAQSIDFSNNLGLSETKIEAIKSLVLRKEYKPKVEVAGEHALEDESQTDGMELRGNGLTIVISGCGFDVGLEEKISRESRGTIKLIGGQASRVAKLVGDSVETKQGGGCCSLQ